MNKKTITIVLMISLMVFLVSCSNSNTPEKTFNEFALLWQNKDYKGMYNQLESSSKSTYPESEFIERLNKIYTGIEASNITITPDYSKKLEKDNSGNTLIPFSAKINTIAGEINFNHTAALKKEKLQDKEKWTIIWNSKMIFPNLEEGEYVFCETKSARRGTIFDKKGIPLAMEGTAKEVCIVPAKVKDMEKAKNALSSILDISIDEINKKIEGKNDTYIPIKTIFSENTSNIIQDLLQIPGILINDKKARIYTMGEECAHLTGYIGPISAEEYEKNKNKGYSVNDYIGKSGIEYYFEEELRPKNGACVYIADKEKKKKLTLAEKAPINGKDINLTIDSDIQRELYKQLKDEAGCGVVIEPKSGQILALASTPSYNPNKFALGISNTDWNKLQENPKNPMINRWAKAFVPGSTFKPITAAIGLRAKKINPSQFVSISGLTWQKDSSWGNYFVTRVSGCPDRENLESALTYSDNIYFAQKALEIGKDIFINESKYFGIGENIPFDIELTQSQVSSNDGIKSEAQLCDSGFGQGEVLMNPIHLALIYSSFVNNADMMKPLIIKDSNKNSEVWKTQVLSKEDLDTLVNCLRKVIESPSGTAHAAYIEGYSLIGKTGTAEIKATVDDTQGTEYGWFSAVNVENPKLAVVLMIEDVKDKGGSHYVVPKVKEIFEKFK